jgi:hypothetical protein
LYRRMHGEKGTEVNQMLARDGGCKDVHFQQKAFD